MHCYFECRDAVHGIPHPERSCFVMWNMYTLNAIYGMPCKLCSCENRENTLQMSAGCFWEIHTNDEEQRMVRVTLEKETMGHESFQNLIEGEATDLAVTDRVFLDIGINGNPAGRLELALYRDKAPLTVENFKQLCLGTPVRPSLLAAQQRVLGASHFAKGWQTPAVQLAVQNSYLSWGMSSKYHNTQSTSMCSAVPAGLSPIMPPMDCGCGQAQDES